MSYGKTHESSPGLTDTGVESTKTTGWELLKKLSKGLLNIVWGLPAPNKPAPRVLIEKLGDKVTSQSLRDV